MLGFNDEKDTLYLDEYKEKSLDIVSISGLSNVEWDKVFDSFKRLVEPSAHHKKLTSKLLTETHLSDHLRQVLLGENPGLRKVQSILLRAMSEKKHLIHIRSLGLKYKSADEQAIGFAAISLTMGLPLAADKESGKVVWDVMNRERRSSAYPTFSEGTGEAAYHTDTAFYKWPARYFGLYCRKPAVCGGGVNRFCNAAELRRRLTGDPAYSWIVKTLCETNAIFRVPSSFMKGNGEEFVEARVFDDDIAIRLRLDSIVKGFQLKYGRQDEKLLRAINDFLFLADMPENRIKIKLEEDSAIYINNHEVLHYRDRFTDSARHLMRIWLK
ncbi:TauD/TfdA family dioxygenase [Halomonas elongata]|uniref:TauD/TfdA family dioxygenase n=1 Tax=Halomonas elongata TaxID=2746 RepID=UPI00255ABF28|nr:TauD/TfdA family dioxygenase [Halomonas elongata]MDL4861084.1 TauD/TfdA family dioxygenase [Halomonas elongata]